MGHVIGPTKDESNAMYQSVLTFTSHVAPRRSIRRLTLVETKRESEIAKRANFEKIKKLGDSMTLPSEELKPLVVDANDFDFNTRKMMKTNLLSG